MTREPFHEVGHLISWRVFVHWNNALKNTGIVMKTFYATQMRQVVRGFQMSQAARGVIVMQEYDSHSI